MAQSELTPELQKRIHAHGVAWNQQIRAHNKKRKKLGLPDHVPLYENKTQGSDRLLFGVFSDKTQEPTLIGLKTLIFAARIANEKISSYRDTLRNTIQALREPVQGTSDDRDGYSLKEINTHVSQDDLEALVFEIWKQNPTSVRSVPYKKVWDDQKDPPGATEAEVQVLLYDSASEAEPGFDLGIIYSEAEGWRIGIVHRNGYRLLRRWRNRDIT